MTESRTALAPASSSVDPGGRGCTYGAVKQFTDENGKIDGPFCVMCIKQLVIDGNLNTINIK